MHFYTAIFIPIWIQILLLLLLLHLSPVYFFFYSSAIQMGPIKIPPSLSAPLVHKSVLTLNPGHPRLPFFIAFGLLLHVRFSIWWWTWRTQLNRYWCFSRVCAEYGRACKGITNHPQILFSRPMFPAAIRTRKETENRVSYADGWLVAEGTLVIHVCQSVWINGFLDG